MRRSSSWPLTERDPDEMNKELIQIKIYGSHINELLLRPKREVLQLPVDGRFPVNVMLDAVV